MIRKLIFLLPVWFSFNSSAQSDTVRILDTSRYAILQKDSLNPVALSPAELQKAENIFREALKAFGLSAKIDFNRYRIQLFPFVNSVDQKEVSFNCFCYLRDLRKNWRKLFVPPPEDGGACYFGVTINLVTNLYYEFWINGIG